MKAVNDSPWYFANRNPYIAYTYAIESVLHSTSAVQKSHLGVKKQQLNDCLLKAPVVSDIPATSGIFSLSITLTSTCGQ